MDGWMNGWMDGWIQKGAYVFKDDILCYLISLGIS